MSIRRTISGNGQLNLRYADGSPFFLSYQQVKLIFALLDGPLSREQVREIYFGSQEGPMTKVQRASLARSLKRLRDTQSITIRADGMFEVDEGSHGFFEDVRQQFEHHYEGTKEDVQQRMKEAIARFRGNPE